MLPKEFESRMETLLGEEYEDFIASYRKPHCQSLRVNALKADTKAFALEGVFSLEPVAWCQSGYYYGEPEQPGRHPYHAAGVYYIQEASAMLPATYLGARPGEKVLDLCAAPGGKSSQIACDMQGEGLLLCNEIHPARAKILSENIERMGIRNAVVLSETPQVLKEAFPEYFDRILVDAPCSGEGMFRKKEEAQKEWSLANVELCARRQDEILACAAAMLKPGGRLVYSTCTFAPLENEGTIGRFLEQQPNFYLSEAKLWEGMEGGRPEWMEKPSNEIRKTIRLWPHKIRGEGHFAAVLEKEPAQLSSHGRKRKEKLEQGLSAKECQAYERFAKEQLFVSLDGKRLAFGEQLYLAPKELPSLHKLKVLRPGLHLGSLKKGRFEPSHALALALKPQEVANSLCLPKDAEQLRAYLRGETFLAEQKKGWCLICAGEYSIGWGKLAGGIMKNHYPKGLRKNSG